MGYKGFLESKEGSIKMSDQKDFENILVQYHLLELHFSCKGPDICSIDNFLM